MATVTGQEALHVLLSSSPSIGTSASAKLSGCGDEAPSWLLLPAVPVIQQSWIANRKRTGRADGDDRQIELLLCERILDRGPRPIVVGDRMPLDDTGVDAIINEDMRITLQVQVEA